MLDRGILVNESESIKDALKKLDTTGYKILLVVDSDDKLLGTATDGDIRRHILKGKSLNSDISRLYNKKPHYLKQGYFAIDSVKRILIENEMELIPILNDENNVVDFITWNQAFSEEKLERVNNRNIDLPVVIMAGGRGTRLEPFSRILPKALIPIGDKSIIEIIIDEFRKQGVKKYYLTLNHKGNMIESYFSDLEKDYEIRFIKEEDFLGTAGSLKLLEDKIPDMFIVSNCDVIVKANFEEVITLHKKKKASMTVLSSIQHYKIPYGVVSFKKGGEVTDITEKPEYTFTVNTGVYILNKESLQFIPEKSHFDMTDLVKGLFENNKKVVIYPVNVSDYIDIGQWEEYKKTVEKLHFYQT